MISWTHWYHFIHIFLITFHVYITYKFILHFYSVRTLSRVAGKRLTSVSSRSPLPPLPSRARTISGGGSKKLQVCYWFFCREDVRTIEHLIFSHYNEKSRFILLLKIILNLIDVNRHSKCWLICFRSTVFVLTARYQGPWNSWKINAYLSIHYLFINVLAFNTHFTYSAFTFHTTAITWCTEEWHWFTASTLNWLCSKVCYFRKGTSFPLSILWLKITCTIKNWHQK